MPAEMPLCLLSIFETNSLAARIGSVLLNRAKVFKGVVIASDRRERGDLFLAGCQAQRDCHVAGACPGLRSGGSSQ